MLNWRLTISTRERSSFVAVLAIMVSTFSAKAAFAEDGVSYRLLNGETVGVLDRFQECDVCPEMIVMPLGSFMMGAIEGESRNPYYWYDDRTLRRREPGELNITPNEHPRHLVEMDIPYAIGRNEVTHREWMSCVDAGSCSHNPDHRVLTPTGYVDLGPDHPVVNVSYHDVQDYAAWLNAQVEADVYRLPTEAEWEYAARAGTTTRFAQGDDLTADQANFARNTTENLRGHPMPDLVDRWMPVRVEELDAANGWGVRHMSGNVLEITMSCWSEIHLGLPSASAYLAHARANTPCPISAGAHRIVGKGGRFTTAMDSVRPARRTQPSEDRRVYSNGFRLIREFQAPGVSQ